MSKHHFILFPLLIEVERRSVGVVQKRQHENESARNGHEKYSTSSKKLFNFLKKLAAVHKVVKNDAYVRSRADLIFKSVGADTKDTQELMYFPQHHHT